MSEQGLAASARWSGWLSLSGRIPRQQYLLAYVVPFVAANTLAHGVMVMAAKAGEPGPVVLAYAVLVLFCLFVSVAGAVKRLHDRGKSGWWALLALVPVVGGLWWLVECCLLPGTSGTNRFGPDPLEGGFRPRARWQ